MGIEKFLYNETIGKMPLDSQGNPTPALLFANSGNKVTFGDLYLFSNFGVAGGNTITASSDITNNYVENNTQRQDHWAINPITYTITGYIGQVIYKPSNIVTGFLQDKVLNYLEPLYSISPTVSSYVQTAMNTIHQIEANYQKFSKYAQNIVTAFNSLSGQEITTYNSNAHMVFESLNALRNNRCLVDVYTPYGTFKDMAMTNISISEEENSKYKWNITIQLQEYRQIETWVRQASEGELRQLVQSEQLEQQASAEKNNGNVTSNSVLFNKLAPTKPFENYGG